MRHVFLLVTALVAVAFAGCTGGGDAGLPQDTLGPSPTDGGAAPPTTGGENETEPKDPREGPDCSSDDPKFHTHDYWGIRETYTLYDGIVSLADDPREETEVTAQGATLGQKVFTTEDDGDDDGAADKTDVVYQGTKEILVRLEWSAATIPGVAFAFKHANTPEFGEPIPAQSGQEFTISLQSRWADMAHQDSVSRWAFQLAAYNAEQSSSPFQAHVARGDVDVFMEIHRGDPSQIDPPHPAFYCEADVLDAGQIDARISNGAMVTIDGGGTKEQVVLAGQWDGLQPPAPHIVPTETSLLRAWLYYNYTGAAGENMHALGLKYHGADTVEYTYPEAADASDGYAYYEIEVDGRMTDSPYAFQTDWEYGVYPIVNGQEQQGDFQGDFQIVLQTIKG